MTFNALYSSMLASAQAACAVSACPAASSYISIIMGVSILLASFLVLLVLLAVENESSRIPAHRSLP